MLPLGLEAVVELGVVRYLLPLVAEGLGRRQVRVPHRLRRRRAVLDAAARRPATALPSVPSTWNSTSSSRYTRTAHEELICAIDPAVRARRCAYAASSAVAAYGSPCSSQRVRDVRGALRGDRPYRAEEVLEHVVPVAEHVEDDAAAVLGAVVPATAAGPAASRPRRPSSRTRRAPTGSGRRNRRRSAAAACATRAGTACRGRRRA